MRSPIPLPIIRRGPNGNKSPKDLNRPLDASAPAFAGALYDADVRARAAAEARGAQAGMYVSMNSSLTGGKAQWPEFVDLARKLGYGGVDVNLPAAMKLGLQPTAALFASRPPRPSYCSLPFNATRDDA